MPHLEDAASPDPAEQARQQSAARAAIDALIGRLDGLVQDQISKKALIEDRWIRDLRQYNGRYEPNIEADLITEKKSRLFINETRAKTHSWEARLSDMLFPAGEVNWDIQPTPVPELMGATALIPPGGDDFQRLQEIQKLAQARSVAMKAEIKDQLVEAQYDIKSRQVVYDGCRMGAGVMKGPTVESRTRRKYEQVDDLDDDGKVIPLNSGDPKRIWKLSETQDPLPGWERVDPFNYYPDMSARTVDEAEFHFELHRKTKKQLRKLARKPGFDKDEIRRMLEAEPRDQVPDVISRLRDVTGATTQDTPDKYTVWEYHGPVEPEELRAIALARFEGQAQIDLLDSIEKVDPLDEQDVVIWFSDGHLLKFGPALLETGDPIYSVWCFEKDDSNIFGFGVPYLMRDSQAAMNAAWRMTMDNAGLSVGPQIVINRDLVEPVNGVWDLEPKKLWYKTKNLPFPTTAFETFHIDSRQVELANIIEMARGFADDETNMPLIAQGEQGTMPRQTAQGMAMLMSSVNVVFRRSVKNFDDQMTTPNIRRAYDWNMAFNPKDFIKGDFEVAATGSSVLLVRELLAQNLMTMLQNFGNDPVLGPITKVPEMYRELFQSLMLPAAKFVMSDQEIEVKAKEAAAQPPPPDPEMEKIAAQLNAVQIRADTDLKIAQIQQETALMQLAEKLNMTTDQLRTKLQAVQIQDQAAAAGRRLPSP